MAGTVIGEELTVEGEITSDEEIVVDGTLRGTLSTADNVSIGPGGVVEADVQAASLVVAGQMTGNVTATDRIDLQAGGRLVGDGGRGARSVVRELAHHFGASSATEHGDPLARTSHHPGPPALPEARCQWDASNETIPASVFSVSLCLRGEFPGKKCTLDRLDMQPAAEPFGVSGFVQHGGPSRRYSTIPPNPCVSLNGSEIQLSWSMPKSSAHRSLALTSTL